MELPEITEVERLHLEPGDCLVVHLNVSEISEDDAAYVKEKVRAVLGLPHLPVLVLARDMSIRVLSS